MLKQNLIGSEVVAMMMVRGGHGVYGVPGNAPNRAPHPDLYTQFQGQLGNPSHMGYVQSSYRQPDYLLSNLIHCRCDENDNLTMKEYSVPSNIPVILLNYLVDNIGGNNEFIITSNELNELIKGRLNNSLIKMELDNVLVKFTRKEPNIDIAHHRYKPEYIIDVIFEDVKLDLSNFKELFQVIDELLSTLKYEEFLYLKNRRHTAE